MDDQLRELVALGREHFQRGDYSLAAGHLEQAVARGVAFADVHHMLGVIYHHLGEFEAAQRALQKALEINPAYVEAGLNLAIVCNDLGQYDRAQQVYGAALQRARARGKREPNGDEPMDSYTRGKIANLHAAVADGYLPIRRPSDAAGKYQGGEYPLAADGELVIGRSSDLEMVLFEDMVSRKHAKLTLAEDQITIADLGSTNGTFVNGEKVRRARLKEGDRILIGTSILKLVSMTRQAGAPVIDAKAAQQNLERTAAAQEKKSGGRTAVQGRLEEVPLVDLLQLLSTSKKTGAIVIKGYRSGRVHLRSGKVVSAVIDADPTLPPKEAL